MTITGQSSGPNPFEERYEVLGELGRGGFGIVWKARQRSTGQLCALKTLILDDRAKKQGADRALKRFEREMELIAKLDSPYIVRLFDSGLTPDGNPFLALELVRGVTLRSLLRKGPLEPSAALAIMTDVLKAVANAHEHNVVHRDLKPDNIMVSVRSGRVNAKVLDFGIAGVVEDAAESNLTLDQDVLGTPCYMPPEQIRMTRDAQPAADVYALGLILYEMLTGKKAVTGATVHMILAAQFMGSIELPEELRDTPIASVIEHATRKDHDERLQNAAEFLNELEQVHHSQLPIGAGALSIAEIAAIEKEDAKRSDVSDVASLRSSPFNSGSLPNLATADGMPGLERATQEGQSGSGRGLIVVALLLLLGAVGFAAFMMVGRSGAAPVEGESAEASARLSDEELGIDALLSQAREAKRDGRVDDAMLLYRKVIARDPKHYEAREELGWILLSLQRFKEALAEFDFLVDEKVERESVLLGVSLSYEGVGDLGAAQAAFGRFIERYPESERRADVEARLAALQPEQPPAPEPPVVEPVEEPPAEVVPEPDKPTARRRRRRRGRRRAAEPTDESFERVKLFE